MADDEDQIDEELGAPDPEATGQEALDTIGDAAPDPAPAEAPPEGITGQPGQELQPPAPMGAPPALATPTIAPPSMVPAGTHATKGSRTVTAMQPNADLVGGQAAEQQVFKDEKKLAADQAALQGRAAQIEQERAEKVAEETARQNAAIQAEQQHQADLAQQRAEQFSRDLDELKRQKPPGGFSEWAGGKRAQASLSITLGGLAAGRTGTANLALADVNREVEQEQRRYQQGIQQQFEVLSRRQGLNHELDNQAKDALARGQARKVLALNSLDKYADAQLKALGIPAAQQAGIKAQLGFDKQAAEAQQKYGQLLASKVTDTTKFAPGKAGAGGGGGDIVNLVKMAENGSKRSEIVAAAKAAGIPEKAWKNQVDLAFVEREKGEAAKEKEKAGTQQRNEATEIRDVDGNVIGHAPSMGTRLNPEVAHADTRVGNARALISAFEELRQDVAENGNNLFPGTVKSRNRSALIANIQAAKRVAESLPASEGGLHLEEAQMPGSGQLIGVKTSPELIDKSIARIRDKVNKQNAAIVHDRPAAQQSGGEPKPASAKRSQEDLKKLWDSATPVGGGSR